MFHSLFSSWLGFVEHWGYAGVFLLMALESTVFPIPSEIIVPPAAYLATRGSLAGSAGGGMSVPGVVLAATLGSWLGAALSYGAARAIGRPLILRYGRYVFVPEEKWHLAERWIQEFAAGGVFFARLLPVLRHLVSLPAGAARMRFSTFTLMTLTGSALWCTVLAWFGRQVLGDQPDLRTRPDALTHVLREKLLWFVVAAAVFLLLYVAVHVIGRRLKRPAPQPD
jgi:membrane protein DedA with SNARE-associated domain